MTQHMGHLLRCRIDQPNHGPDEYANARGYALLLTRNTLHALRKNLEHP